MRRRCGWASAARGIGRDDEPPAALERVDIDDFAGHCDRAELALQHRGAALDPRLLHHRKPGGDKSQHDGRIAQRRPAAQPQRERDGAFCQGEPDPQLRFDRQGEIKRDPGGEKHRDPQDPSVTFGGQRLG